MTWIGAVNWFSTIVLSVVLLMRGFYLLFWKGWWRRCRMDHWRVPMPVISGWVYMMAKCTLLTAMISLLKLRACRRFVMHFNRPIHRCWSQFIEWKYYAPMIWRVRWWVICKVAVLLWKASIVKGIFKR